MNSLLGRFGLSINKPITSIVNTEQLNELLISRDTIGHTEIDSDSHIVNYYPDINKEILETHGIEIVKFINKYGSRSFTKPQKYKGVSVAISSAVTAYGRIHISKLKQKVLSLNGSIYYSDTDSLITNVALPEEFIDNKEIGKLKLEHKVSKGYFISNKTYCLVLPDGESVIKTKGILSSSLNVEDFVNMYKGKTINAGVKLSAIRDYFKGSVTITENKNIKIDPASYTKKTKVYVVVL